MRFWIEFLFDKRFGFRFKLANLIMGDYLRNYLCVDRVAMENVKSWITFAPDLAKRKVAKIQADIEYLCEM